MQMKFAELSIGNTTEQEWRQWQQIFQVYDWGWYYRRMPTHVVSCLVPSDHIFISMFRENIWISYNRINNWEMSFCLYGLSYAELNIRNKHLLKINFTHSNQSQLIVLKWWKKNCVENFSAHIKVCCCGVDVVVKQVIQQNSRSWQSFTFGLH